MKCFLNRGWYFLILGNFDFEWTLFSVVVWLGDDWFCIRQKISDFWSCYFDGIGFEWEFDTNMNGFCLIYFFDGWSEQSVIFESWIWTERNGSVEWNGLQPKYDLYFICITVHVNCVVLCSILWIYPLVQCNFTRFFRFDFLFDAVHSFWTESNG